ncbi:MAG: hypothetical protein F6K03_05395, partial [Kamptonema sp. SIO4C4]|nr:hypothetical protein [Kamptonema sp. SIO4C4]
MNSINAFKQSSFNKGKIQKTSRSLFKMRLKKNYSVFIRDVKQKSLRDKAYNLACVHKSFENAIAQKDVSHFLTFTGVVKSAPKHADEDRYHLQAVRGFQQLQKEGQPLILPLPIVFEVHRWLLQQQGPQLAQSVFAAIERRFQIYTISESDLAGIKQIILNVPQWLGTLADASVVYVAMKLDC